jgi:hypothetical protein
VGPARPRGARPTPGAGKAHRAGQGRPGPDGPDDGRTGSVGGRTGRICPQGREKVGRHAPKSREGRRQAVVPAVHRPTEALGDRIQELRLPPLGGTCRPRRQEQQEAAAEWRAGTGAAGAGACGTPVAPVAPGPTSTSSKGCNYSPSSGTTESIDHWLHRPDRRTPGGPRFRALWVVCPQVRWSA